MDLLRRLLGLSPSMLEERYRARELWSGARAETPLALRLDGVSWGRRLSVLGYRWPRDPIVHRGLARAAAETMAEHGGDMAYVTSDEVSILFLSGAPYGGRVEKLDSIYAAGVAARVSLRLGAPLPLDARVVKLRDERDAALYIMYRARVGLNNYVSSLYHGLGLGLPGNTPPLSEMLEALRSNGVEPLKESWAALGSCVVRLPSVKTGPGIEAERRRLAILDTPEPCIEALRGDAH